MTLDKVRTTRLQPQMPQTLATGKYFQQPRLQIGVRIQPPAFYYLLFEACLLLRGFQFFR